MLCPICHGARLLLIRGLIVPCPECQGHGEVHCCDGLQEQPLEPTALSPSELDEEPREDGVS